MNFFQNIADMNIAGGLTIHITTEQGNRFVVSVLYTNSAVSDKAAQTLPPILLRGTASEVDEGFFEKIKKPLQETEGLLTSMEQYLKQREQVKKQSQMEKDSKTETDKKLTDKEKKYQVAMKVVDELEAAGKYRDAWMKVPSNELYPEHGETIRERKTALARKFAPEMFTEEA